MCTSLSGSTPRGSGEYQRISPSVAIGNQPRFRVGVYLQAQNLTNHYNYGGFQGGMLSPFFGQPTLVINPRKIDMGLQFQF